MKICIFIVLAAIVNHCLCFELLSAAIVGVGSIIGKYTYCKIAECCTKEEIPANFTRKPYICLNFKYCISSDFVSAKIPVRRKTVWSAFGARHSSKCLESPLDR